MTSPLNSHQRICNLFDAWWQESYPMAPANNQARERFVAFGIHLEKRFYLDLISDASPQP
jgi:hypothetical protein